MRTLRWAIGTILLAMLVAAPARAALVIPGRHLDSEHLMITGTPGDDVITVRLTDTAIVVTDAGTLTAASSTLAGPCTRPDAHTVSCVRGPALWDLVDVETGDGNDLIDLRGGPKGFLDGGRGDDRIYDGDGDSLINGDFGDDWIDGGGGADRIYGGSSTSDWMNDVIAGGPGDDWILAAGGYDRVDGGPGADAIAAWEIRGTEPWVEPILRIPDEIECGDADDLAVVDTFDVSSGCERLQVASCDAAALAAFAYNCFQVGGPEPIGSFSSGGGAAPATPVATEQPPSEAAPVASVPVPAPRPAALTMALRLDVNRLRPPLRFIPRGLIALSDTATVTLTLAREVHGRWVARDGRIERRLGGGLKNISLTVLLGGRQTFPPGRYRLAASARTDDGRTATAATVLRMLAPRR